MVIHPTRPDVPLEVGPLALEHRPATPTTHHCDLLENLLGLALQQPAPLPLHPGRAFRGGPTALPTGDHSQVRWCPSFVEQPGSSAIPPATRHDQLTRPTSPASAPANDPRRRGPATSEPANRSCTDTA